MITTNRRIPLIAVGAALVLIGIWYFSLWSPQVKNLQAAHKADAAAVLKVSQLQTQEGQLRSLVKQIPVDNARLEQLEAAFPNNPQLDQALSLIQQAAIASGVTVSSVSSPAAATSSAGSKAAEPSINLSLSVRGPSGQLTSFLAALTSLPRTVVVDSVSLSSGADATATIQAKIFYAGQPTP